MTSFFKMNLPRFQPLSRRPTLNPLTTDYSRTKEAPLMPTARSENLDRTTKSAPLTLRTPDSNDADLPLVRHECGLVAHNHPAINRLPLCPKKCEISGLVRHPLPAFGKSLGPKAAPTKGAHMTQRTHNPSSVDSWPSRHARRVSTDTPRFSPPPKGV
jgi:hypothetical protein